MEGRVYERQRRRWTQPTPSGRRHAEGGASGAEKGKKRDEIASISNDEPSGGTRVETDGLKGGGVEHDDGDGGDASPESASPSSRSSTGGSSRNGRSAVSAAALVGGSASGSETLTEPAGGPHAGLSGTPAPPQASGSADAGLQLQLQPAAQQHAPSARNLAGQEQQHAAQPPAANVGAPDAADRRGALAIKERTDQARKLDAGLFRGTALAPMETALGGLGVEAIVVGGCCELNTTAHGLIVDIGTQLGIRAATASGEDVNQCVALETTRVRQRIAIEIWSNYQDYICARLKFADPTPDKQRANEDEAVTNAAEQELHAQRYAIQAYLHRTHQPLELGV